VLIEPKAKQMALDIGWHPARPLPIFFSPNEAAVTHLALWAGNLRLASTYYLWASSASGKTCSKPLLKPCTARGLSVDGRSPLGRPEFTESWPPSF
jgi:hypothetical protein